LIRVHCSGNGPNAIPYWYTGPDSRRIFRANPGHLGHHHSLPAAAPPAPKATRASSQQNAPKQNGRAGRAGDSLLKPALSLIRHSTVLAGLTQSKFSCQHPAITIPRARPGWHAGVGDRTAHALSRSFSNDPSHPKDIHLADPAESQACLLHALSRVSPSTFLPPPSLGPPSTPLAIFAPEIPRLRRARSN
jgi:hypothetical protein